MPNYSCNNIHCLSFYPLFNGTSKQRLYGPFRILGLQPRDKEAKLVVNTKEIFLLNLHQSRVHFPAERNALVLDSQHGRRDVTSKPAIRSISLFTHAKPIFLFTISFTLCIFLTVHWSRGIWLEKLPNERKMQGLAWKHFGGTGRTRDTVDT